MKLFPVIKLPKLFRSDKADTERSNRVDTVEKASLQRIRVDSEEKNGAYRKPAHNKNGRDKARDHLDSLRAAIDVNNEKMERRGIPVRFEIIERDEELYIKLVRLNSYGDVINVIRKDITHEEFPEIIREIEEGEGLLFNEEF